MKMKYVVKVRLSASATASEVVKKEAAAGFLGTLKLVAGDKLSMHRVPIYVDSVSSENLCGSCVEIEGVDQSEWLGLLVNADLKGISVANNEMLIEASVEEKAKDKNGRVTVKSEAIEKAEGEKVEACLIPKEEADKIIDYLLANKVPEDLILEVIGNWTKYNRPVHTPKTIYVDSFLSDEIKRGNEGVICDGLRSALMRMPTIIEGEKSVGKNVFLETIAWVLQMPLYLIGFSRMMSPSAVFGDKTTDNSAAERLSGMRDGALASVMLTSPHSPIRSMSAALNAAADFKLAAAEAAAPHIVVDHSELYDWLSDGGLMVFNELNMADGNFFSSFANPLTDGTGFVPFPDRGNVNINPRCVLFGTQNADYEGVQNQNEATMSRFNTMIFPQPKNLAAILRAATEAELVKDGSNLKVPDNLLSDVQKFVDTIYQSIQKGVLSNCALNIRGYVRALRAATKIHGKNSLRHWVQTCVINSCPSEEREVLDTLANEIIRN